MVALTILLSVPTGTLVMKGMGQDLIGQILIFIILDTTTISEVPPQQRQLGKHIYQTYCKYLLCNIAQVLFFFKFITTVVLFTDIEGLLMVENAVLKVTVLQIVEDVVLLDTVSPKRDLG